MGFVEQARLAETHRLAQAKLQALAVQDMAKAFPLLDVNNIDRSFGPFFESAYSSITARRTMSSALGSAFYSGIRKDYDLDDLFTPILESAPDVDKVFTSLLVTGPIAMKKNLAAGVDPLIAKQSALKTVSKAAQRHTIDGGRETVRKSVARDRYAIGWARLTDGKPCAFCALLASRGPAYKSEGTSKFRSHDGCGCTAVPVFDASAPWPGRAEEFRRQYDENISGKFAGGDGNNAAVKAWRNYYDIKVEPTPINSARAVASNLVEKARKVEPALTGQMETLASKNNAELKGLEYRLKGEDSLTRKILKDVEEGKGLITAEEVGGKMFDVNRYTMQLADDEYVSGAQAVIDELEESGHTLKVKNYWNVDDNPYQGINIQVTAPDGTKFELQLHTGKSLEVKEGELHSIYELARKEKNPLKLAEYDRQSFAAAKKIPVPKGIETVGSRSAAAAPKPVAPWRQKFDDAKKRLPADRSRIGRRGGRDLTAAELKELQEAKEARAFVDRWEKDLKVATAKNDEVVKQALFKEFEKTTGITPTVNQYGTVPEAREIWGNSFRTQKKFDLLRRGEIDAGDYIRAGRGKMKQRVGAEASAHLEDILEAGKSLRVELDLRIAARIEAASLGRNIDEINDAIKAQKKLEKSLEELTEKRNVERLRIRKNFETESRVRSFSDEDSRLSWIDIQTNLYSRIDPAVAKIDKDIFLVTKNLKTTVKQVKEISGEIVPGTKLFGTIQREETLKLLAEVRSMDGRVTSYVGARGGAVSDELADAMKFADDSFPRDWIDTVNEQYDEISIGTSGRGYNRGGNEIRLSQHLDTGVVDDKGYFAVAVHELGHSMEKTVPGLSEMEWAFHSRRALITAPKGDQFEPEKWLGSGYRKTEKSVFDAWTTAYTGKVYEGSPEGSWEVFTTGIESLLAGSKYFGGGAVDLDDDFRDFLIGVLSVL